MAPRRQPIPPTGERVAAERPSISIPGRFNGPPQSANGGGFTCGSLARTLGAGAVEVNLRQPPPLGVELDLAREGERVELRDGDSLIAEARPLSGLDVTPPTTVDLEQATAASRRYPWFHTHVFPTCFVCGPRRPQRDGLELFAGPAAEPSGVHAAPWVPAAEWEQEGEVREEIVWAALDCPSAVPVMSDGKPAVLARLAASREAPVLAERPHVVVSWVIEIEGRKLHSASAILDEQGELLARARALWIELRH